MSSVIQKNILPGFVCRIVLDPLVLLTIMQELGDWNPSLYGQFPNLMLDLWKSNRKNLILGLIFNYKLEYAPCETLHKE
jgi:hypothetical protein